MRYWPVLYLSILLSGCAATPTKDDAGLSYDDRLFGAPAERIDAADVFALSPEMRRYLDTNIAPETKVKGARKGLFDALYSQGQLKLDYDSEITRNAAQAFAARSGNCLSLVILTAALAKELELPVRYQMVYLDDAWSRSDGIEFFDEHVNITLGVKKSRVGQTSRIDSDELTIDFLPPSDLGKRRTRVLGENTIIAMFMNNRAAEALAQRQFDNAYGWARAAIATDPHYVPAYNTLGVIYKLHGNGNEARQVFEYILAIEPVNTIAMSNDVLVLNDLGRTDDAKKMAERLKKIRPYPPFYYFDLGMQALRDRNYASAKTMFTREIERSAYFHESHFWLAVAEYGLGDMRQARKQMATAMELSTTSADHELYAAKLARLKSGRGL
jgi:tetratricopeptide (TPR) repeat protein